VMSPHIAMHELINSYLAKDGVFVPLYKIQRALIKEQYDIYPGTANKFVRNIYAIEEQIDTSPLLGLRLLQLLKDGRRLDGGERFITIEQVIEYSRAMLVDASVTLSWLSALLEGGLCLSYDPTVTTISSVDKVELSHSGFQHLRWATREADYLHAMLEVTPLVDQAIYDQMMAIGRTSSSDSWRERVVLFADYLINEDAQYVKIPEHDAYASQVRLISDLQRTADQQRQRMQAGVVQY
jgi:hypothetical protein